MRLIYSLITSALCLVLSTSLQAQTVENIVASFDGEKASITYDLNHTIAEQKFDITLYSSHNAFQTPLTLVTGDVGKDMLPGKGKIIIWNVRNELPPYFNDDLTFKVKALLIGVPPKQIETKQPTITTNEANNVFKIKTLQNTGYKRGTELKLQWEGGAASDNIKVDLMKDNTVWQSLTPTQNTSSYQWQIPKKQKTGSTYALRISNAANPKQKTTSNLFKIKPKVPVIVKVGIPVLLGVLVGVMVGGKDKGGETPTNGLSDLPGPITPGGG